MTYLSFFQFFWSNLASSTYTPHRLVFPKIQYFCFFCFLNKCLCGKKCLAFITFFWNVPSNAATITVLPRSAISSQNSTTSLNWNDLIKHHFTNNTGTPTSKVCTAMLHNIKWATSLTWKTSSNQWIHLSKVMIIYIIKLVQ